MKNIVVTGGAGFIGSSLIDALLLDFPDSKIFNIDNFDDFYYRKIKEKNIEKHLNNKNYQLVELDIENKEALQTFSQKTPIDVIVHLAAKVGVRPSIENAVEYIETNVTGTLNMLNLAKKKEVRKFILASSSSVYGSNPNVPWQEDDLNLQPISPYAVTKIAAEKLCQTYQSLYGIDTTVLRFFTVYGPKQRPDLAIHKFFRAIKKNEAIPFYGNGDTERDYTYIDDIIDGVIKSMKRNSKGFEIFNLGNNQTISLKELIENIKKVSNKHINIKHLPMQAGDVQKTYANIDKARNELDYNPKTKLEVGLKKFKTWFDNQ